MCDWGKSHRPEYNFGYLRLKGLRILVVAAEAEVRVKRLRSAPLGASSTVSGACPQDIGNRLRTVLEEHDAQALVVASTHAALEVLLQEPPDALIVDIGASSEDSYALIRQVRNLSVEQGGQIPALALTNNDLERSRVIKEGFQVHLAKPFDPVELVAILASLTSYSQ
nr:response regulator [Brasilonema bromeliae]